VVRDARVHERRLVLVVAAVVFVDTMFYAAIAPLLPELARQLNLSKLSAGVMTAAYPLGTLVGSIPGGVLVVRIGPKRTVYVGLALLAASTLAFGLLDNAAALDLARFVEGVGGAFTWSGGLAWLVAQAPPERRGGLIGTAIGAAIGGALFGPVIGTIAGIIGRAATFSGVVALAVLLVDQVRRQPDARTASSQGMRHMLAAARRGPVLGAMWLVALPAVISGILAVLGPLRLHRLGLGVLAIGATFLGAAALEALLSPAVGRLSDRRGRWLPLRFGLGVAGVLLACFTLPAVGAGLAVLIVATDTSLGGVWAPAHALVSDVSDAVRLDQAYAAALMNLSWAAGAIVGEGGGGALAKVSGDALPTGCAAAACAVTLILSLRRRRPPIHRASAIPQPAAIPGRDAYGIPE
jgi:MFS family permease